MKTGPYHYIFEVAEDLLHDLNLYGIAYTEELSKLVNLYCLDHRSRHTRKSSRMLAQAYHDMRQVILGETQPLDTTQKCLDAFVQRTPWYYGCMLINTILRERKPSCTTAL